MNPSLRVFLCGTSIDLADEREAVLGAIERLRLRRDSMELFGSWTDRPIDVCLQEVRQSDVLVVIVAHMYGTLVPEMGISFSEAEYREGYSGGKPCLIYLKSEDVPTLPKHFEPDAHKRDLLGKYKALLQARHTRSVYKDAATLAVQVIADLSRTKEQIAAGGLTPYANLHRDRSSTPPTLPDCRTLQLQRCGSMHRIPLRLFLTEPIALFGGRCSRTS